MTVDIQLDDLGTKLDIVVEDADGTVHDISAATVLKMKFRTPVNTVFERTAVLATDGLDGKLRYVGVAGDWAFPGPWTVQPYVEWSPTETFHGRPKTFDVGGNSAL